MKYITVPTYKDDEESSEPCLFEVVVQKFERWAPMSDDPGNLGSSAEIFLYLDLPTTLDVLRLSGTDPANRNKFFVWNCGESDVEGAFISQAQSACSRQWPSATRAPQPSACSMRFRRQGLKLAKHYSFTL